MRYVDRAAQAADWGAHKPECAALAACSAPPSPTIRLAARCLWWAGLVGRVEQQAEQHVGRQAALARDRVRQGGCGTAALDALESHWDDLSPARQALYAGLAVATRTFMTGGGRDSAAPDLPSIARLIARLAVNAHTITGGAGIDRVGLGLYPGPGAMANHGEPPAGPTAVQAFEGGTLTLRALAALPSGAEVMLSYVDPATPRPARRVALLEGYRFDIDAGLLPQPPPAVEWASPDGSTLAAGFSARPPSVDGDPEACVAMVGPAGEPGGGAVAWLESGSSQDGVDAAASFGLGVEEDGQERGPPPRPSVCRVVAWGGCAASPAFLARTAACLATMERAARGVETCLAGRSLAPSPERADALAAALAGGAAGRRAILETDPGPAPAPGPAHFSTGRLAFASSRAALAAGDWAGALADARAAIPLLDAALPRAAPVRAHLWAERAKLAALAGGEAGGGAALDAEALAAAEEAAAALAICSPAAPALAEMAALIENLQAEAAARERTEREGV